MFAINIFFSLNSPEYGCYYETVIVALMDGDGLLNLNVKLVTRLHRLSWIAVM